MERTLVRAHFYEGKFSLLKSITEKNEQRLKKAFFKYFDPTDCITQLFLKRKYHLQSLLVFTNVTGNASFSDQNIIKTLKYCPELKYVKYSVVEKFLYGGVFVWLYLLLKQQEKKNINLHLFSLYSKTMWKLNPHHFRKIVYMVSLIARECHNSFATHTDATFNKKLQRFFWTSLEVENRGRTGSAMLEISLGANYQVPRNMHLTYCGLLRKDALQIVNYPSTLSKDYYRQNT